MSQIVRIGRKYAVYLPKSIVDKLMLQEGDKLFIKAEENQIVLKPIPKLLTKRSYWTETTIQEFEAEAEDLTQIAEGE